MEPVSAAHADHMDRMYRYQRHIYDLTRKYYLLGRDTAIRALDAREGMRVLEVGCGTGRNLQLIRAHYPDAHLYGLDISREMLESAGAKFAHASTKPTLVAADATNFLASDFGPASFDRILISYSLSMIPDWQKAIEAALSALADNGSLHVIDFGLQEHLPRWFHLMLTAWLKRFHVTPRADLGAVMASAAARHGGVLEEASIARGYARHCIIRKVLTTG